MNEVVPLAEIETIGGKAVPGEALTWLVRLHTLIAGGAHEGEAGERVRLVAPFIADRFPAEAFTQRSLEHVASKCVFWPAYAELVQHLREWWRDNRPVQLALATPAPPPRPEREGGPDPEEAANVEATLRQWKADMADRAREQERRERVARKPLRDVTLKGEPLWLARNDARAALNMPPLPKPESWDGYGELSEALGGGG